MVTHPDINPVQQGFTSFPRRNRAIAKVCCTFVWLAPLWLSNYLSVQLPGRMNNTCLFFFCLPSLMSGSFNCLFVFLPFKGSFVWAAWLAFPRKLQIAGCWRSCCFVTLPSASNAGRVALWHALWIWGLRVQVWTPSWEFSFKLT